MAKKQTKVDTKLRCFLAGRSDFVYGELAAFVCVRLVSVSLGICPEHLVGNWFGLWLLSNEDASSATVASSVAVFR